MNSTIKFIIVALSLVSLATVISSYIPTDLTDSLNNAIIYFLTQLHVLGYIMHVDVLFICIKWLFSIVFGLGVVAMGMFVVKVSTS